MIRFSSFVWHAEGLINVLTSLVLPEEYSRRGKSDNSEAVAVDTEDNEGG